LQHSYFTCNHGLSDSNNDRQPQMATGIGNTYISATMTDSVEIRRTSVHDFRHGELDKKYHPVSATMTVSGLQGSCLILLHICIPTLRIC